MFLFLTTPPVVGRATVLHPEDNLTYRMTSSPRGLALLIGRVGKNPVFKKKTQPSGFFGFFVFFVVYWVFLGFLGFFGFFWVF
jgi:hypothetical protein